MKHYCDYIPLPLAEKLKEKGMPMEVWDRTVQGMPYIAIMERIPYNWFDDEMGILEPQMVERRYSIPTYAEVFDWLMEKGKRVYIIRAKFSAELWHGRVNDDVNSKGYPTWHEAAEKAIEKALTLI